MISKKTKALAAAMLSAAMTATAVVPAVSSAAAPKATSEALKSDESYISMFESLYDDVMTNGVSNGFMSEQNNGAKKFGIPYHAVETLVVEAPDYGHETTSEAMSYIVWMAAMHDALVASGQTSGGNDLADAWKIMEALIPGWSTAANRSDIDYGSIWEQERLKADTAAEGDDPSDYPTEQPNVDAINPMYDAYKSAYGSDNGYYLMNWLADVDDWYGFSKGTKGEGKFTFINTFQRGEEESCFETVPAPCLEELKWGMESKNQDNGNGIKAIFNGLDKVPSQYSFTNAPDAEDRAIQAIYFANQHGVNCGEISALAGKMGDQCRNDMFDKYYKAIAKDTTIRSESAGMDSKHYLMAWYTAWGGALKASYGNYGWAWQIGCSHSHQFYQNPLAAYGLLYDKNINSGMKAKDADADYTESLKRQIEMYLWLQSKEGPFAGGCTNSYKGRYEAYPADLPTFYDMVFVAHPVYADPGSNHWIGNQVWSTQRLAELYYYVKTNGDQSNVKPGGMSLEDALEALLERWIKWFEEKTQFDYVTEDGQTLPYAIPSNLDWGKGGHHTDPDCVPDTWTGTYNPDGNQSLSCTITGYGMGDYGCVSSLCNTLIYYAKANNVDPKYANEEGTTTAEKGLYLANKLLSYQYDAGRDDLSLGFKDHNGSLKRIFEQVVYIPDYYSGKMPDESELKPGATFSSIRKNYEKDKMWQDCKAVYDATGETEGYEYTLHRFWHAGDAIMAYGGMALLYPEVTPMTEGAGGTKPVETTTAATTTVATTSPTTASTPDGDVLWGDANCDGNVDVSDAVIIMQSISNPSKYTLTAQGKINGDVSNNGDGITNADALSIQKYKLELITKLPES
ncbi:MAG: Cellulose 1,4-beta-cellobiosidase (reducing end) CelS precursor [Firmicutes bacterium ADurb.BinA205]|nr:MAG: Cellulose 1,4-beta-cellobiosidase (reducing end) CelS precursor [Firmicutes bacterium ADurb.BinA205]